jgi:lysophospholipase L1-like esterase
MRRGGVLMKKLLAAPSAPLLILLLVPLLLVPAADAARPAKGIEVGRAALSPPGPEGRSLLVPVRYPIEMAGRGVELKVTLLDGEELVLARPVRVRANAGPNRRPERRRRFLFVHRVDLGPGPSARLADGLRLRAYARAILDADRDGEAELRVDDAAAQQLTARPGGGSLCSTLPRLRAHPGERVSVPLPACAAPVRWRLGREARRGSAEIRDGLLVYRAGRRFRGTEELRLVAARARGASASAASEATVSVAPVTVGNADRVVVRALGDSVTAGFGYYSNGRPMTVGRLLECRPPASGYDDACSSNSLNFTNKGKEVIYAPDYGLANNVSWAAQWANEHGVTDYQNLAISGSEPKDWAPGGQFHATTERIAAEDPDYLLLTMGANPLLSNMLFGFDNMGCAIYSQIVGGYSQCIERAFAQIGLRTNLRNLYEDLVERMEATIYLMQYHLSVPSTALAYTSTQIAEMGVLLNREIAAVAAEVEPRRLRVVAPPHFNVGIDISPVYPSGFSCSRLGYEVDGPSVQSTPTQTELDVLHPLSFCKGPVPAGPPWVISGDTGIHPSAAGYAQMAAAVPPPNP